MRSFKITIPYTPAPKGSVRTWGMKRYNPSARGMAKTRKYVQENLPEDYVPLSGPLLVITHYRIPAALGVPERKRRPQHLLPHIKRPDSDNLEKFLSDALNGLIWKDDAHIVWSLRSKTVSQEKIGETIIFAKELPHAVPDYEELRRIIQEHITIEVLDVDIS